MKDFKVKKIGEEYWLVKLSMSLAPGTPITEPPQPFETYYKYGKMENIDGIDLEIDYDLEDFEKCGIDKVQYGSSKYDQSRYRLKRR